MMTTYTRIATWLLLLLAAWLVLARPSAAQDSAAQKMTAQDSVCLREFFAGAPPPYEPDQVAGARSRAEQALKSIREAQSSKISRRSIPMAPRP